MGHKQPPAPIQTNNSTALSVITNNIQPPCTKAMDMRYHWLCDCKTQDQFKYYWCPRPTNCTNYWTKHHCTAHHIKKRLEILTPLFILEALCASTKRAPPHREKACSKRHKHRSSLQGQDDYITITNIRSNEREC
jgi:hypothetical protein